MITADELYGDIWCFILVVFSILSQVTSYFSCLGECCNTVLLWSSREVLCTTRLQPTFHQQAEGGRLDFHFCVNCSFKLRTGRKVNQKSRYGRWKCKYQKTSDPVRNGTKQHLNLIQNTVNPKKEEMKWNLKKILKHQNNDVPHDQSRHSHTDLRPAAIQHTGDYLCFDKDKKRKRGEEVRGR